MILKGVIDEDFINYKDPSFVLMFPYCSFKCDRESGKRVCQNSTLSASPDISINTDELCKRYMDNKITSAIVCGGLEPMDSFNDLWYLIYILRYKYHCKDTIVIYTGYTEQECINKGWIEQLSYLKNIIIKFGRFKPDNKPHYDNVLGIMLVSDNQYAKKIC